MRLGRSATALAVGLLVAGCGSSGSASEERVAGAAAPTTASAVPGAVSSDMAAEGNPVVDNDFPDPDVLDVDGTYYAYATNGNARNVQLARSEDLETWETVPKDALPELPRWVIPGKTWAPEVIQVAPDRFVMYLTTTNFQPTTQCIAAATSDSPEGPFEVVGDEMLVCPEEQGGAIDASTFLDDDGTRYLLWKNDGNSRGLDTWLYIAPLSADGLRLAGPPTPLLKQDLPWEGHLIEAPTLVKRDGEYVLLYSANDYGGAEYAIGYATSDSVTGPYTKNREPLLSTEISQGRYIGPGGQDVVTAPDGSDRLVFHSWYRDQTYRGVNMVPLTWKNGKPVVHLDRG